MKRHWNDYWKSYSEKDYRKLAFFLGIVVLVIVTVVYSSQYKPATQVAPQTEAEPAHEIEIETVPPPAPKGSVIIAVKDVKQKLTGVGLGEATELFMTVKSVQVHTTTEALENMSVLASGWITVLEGDKSFDLLQYTDNIALLAEKELDPGNYTQIRLYVSGASVKIDNPLFEISNKTYPLYIPSNVLKIVRPFSVEPDKATVLTIDFDVPKMISRTAQGYTLGPVFRAITNEITVKEQMIDKGKRPENAVDV
ncbi:MAG: DUF4382 domain-containing protein [Candidatus Aenigmarchaeota archaeon]|nr:DUF4382 domain-containing protein [Candidatus Aenigmarchaeota archaeon]